MRVLDRINKVIREHRQEIEKNFNVKKIGVFGSYARGEQKKEAILISWLSSNSL